MVLHILRIKASVKAVDTPNKIEGLLLHIVVKDPSSALRPLIIQPFTISKISPSESDRLNAET
ncbi:hypothetical protein, partial [Vibrio parahaemolyticus]|uniref:hypothetical protein n=1 Tax=Vibrio parahaemolyticus TaxID=670 RepID=UPI001C5ED8E8